MTAIGMPVIRLLRAGLPCGFAALMAPCLAGESPRSGQSDYFANPYIAFGVDPRTQQVTGYVSAHRTGPGRTDSCEFMFRGRLSSDGKARLAIIDPLKEDPGSQGTAGIEAALLSVSNKTVKMHVPKSLAPGDCDWILEFLEGPNVTTTARALSISADIERSGAWIALARIRSKRAFFHRMPDTRTVRKAYVVAGDLVYVMEEKPGWYHVRYGDAAKASAGWVRASDIAAF